MVCPFCKQEIKIKNNIHIYKCDKNLTNDKNLTRFLFITYNHPELDNGVKLKNEYENELKSLPDLKKEYGISYKNTIFLLDYFKIKKRTIKESCFLISKEKYKITCKEKYNVDNISTLESTKNKKKKTFLKNYGVDNIWKSKEYYDWLHKYMLDTYGKKSLPNRYGGMDDYYKTLTDDEKKDKMIPANKAYVEYWNKLSDEEKTNLIQKRTKFVNVKTETIISEVLNKLNISYIHQYWIKRRSYDFKILDTNILIEVNGDFWHGNPCIYNKDDIIYHPFKSVKAKDLWKKDKDKKILAENKGYRLIYIWEKELKENKNNLLDFVINKLK